MAGVRKVGFWANGWEKILFGERPVKKAKKNF